MNRARATLWLVALALLLAAAPEDVVELNDAARSAMDAGRPDEAIALLERARQLDPDEPVLASNLAYAYFLRGRRALEAVELDAARADLERAIQLAPDELGYRVHLAQLHLRRYELREAEPLLRAVLERDEARADAWLLLGDTLNLQDRLAEALQAYEAAAEHATETRIADHARSLAERTRRQYEVEKDYREDNTQFFRILSPAEGEGPLFGVRLSGLLERGRADVSAALDHFPRQRTTVVLYPPESFKDVTGLHDWVGGLFDRKIRLPIGDVERDAEAIEAAFRHEYTHLLVSEFAPQCPTFINEGLAQVMEYGRGTGLERLASWLDAHGGRDRIPRLDELPATFVELAERDAVSEAYLLSHAFIDHVQAMHGLAGVLDWIRALGSNSLAEAYEDATGRTLAHEENLFRERVRVWR